MRINGFRCDVCCKEHLLESGMVALHPTELLPDEWFTLWQRKDGHEKEPLILCSVQCLWDWAEKRITGLREVVPMVEENTRWENR